MGEDPLREGGGGVHASVALYPRPDQEDRRRATIVLGLRVDVRPVLAGRGLDACKAVRDPLVQAPRDGLVGRRAGSAVGLGRARRASVARSIAVRPAEVSVGVGVRWTDGCGRPGRPRAPHDTVDLDLNPRPHVAGPAPRPFRPRKYDHDGGPGGESDVRNLTGTDHPDGAPGLDREGNGVARVEPGLPRAAGCVAPVAVLVPEEVDWLVLIPTWAGPGDSPPRGALGQRLVLVRLTLPVAESGGEGRCRGGVSVPRGSAARPS